MKNTISLKSTTDFQKVLKKGNWYAGDLMSLYVLPCNTPYNLLGIAVGKKYSKSSVKRNKVRRLIKESYRLNEDSILIGYQMVIVWKNNNLPNVALFDNVYKDVIKCFKKANILINREDVDV